MSAALTPKPPQRALVVYWFILSALASFLIFFATRELGAGVSEDSAKYLSASQSIAAGQGVLMYNGEPMTQWPPGYPLLLAVLHLLFGVDVFVAGWVLNIFVFGLVVFASGLVFWRAFGEGSLFAYAGPVLVLTNLGLISAAVNVSSDPLFMLITLLFLLCSESYLRRPRVSTLVWLVVLAILGTFVRYVGVGLVLAGALIVYKTPGLAQRHRLLRAGTFGFVSGLPLLAWVYLRNYAISGTLFGPRTFASPLLNVSLTIDKVVAWFVPDLVLRFVPPLIILLLFVGLLIAASQPNSRKRLLAEILSPAVLPSAVFALCYLGVLAVTSSYYEFRTVGFDRVHAILLPSLLVLAFTLVSQLPSRLKARLAPVHRRTLLAGVLIVLILFSGFRMQKYVRLTADRGDTIFNFANTHALRESELASYLLETPELLQGRLFSNNEAALWFYVRSRIERVPRVGQETDWPQGVQGHLVWFLGDLDYKPDLIAPEPLVGQGWLQPVFMDELGIVYRITAPGD